MKSWEDGEIEKIARDIWLRQGCPGGREQEHWFEAEDIFRQKWLAEREGPEHQVRDLRAKGENH